MKLLSSDLAFSEIKKRTVSVPLCEKVCLWMILFLLPLVFLVSSGQAIFMRGESSCCSAVLSKTASFKGYFELLIPKGIHSRLLRCCEHIKKEFDRRHGPTWHCIVGRNFGNPISTLFCFCGAVIFCFLLRFDDISCYFVGIVVISCFWFLIGVGICWMADAVSMVKAWNT